MSSKRQIIKADVIAALKTIAGVATVTDKWHRFDEVESSRMPFLMVISNEETRNSVNSQRDTECEWLVDVWAYLNETHDSEAWVELVRAKIMTDRSRGTTGGSPNALDTFIPKITNDNAGLASPGSVFLMTVRVTYRVRE